MPRDISTFFLFHLLVLHNVPHLHTLHRLRERAFLCHATFQIVFSVVRYCSFFSSVQFVFLRRRFAVVLCSPYEHGERFHKLNLRSQNLIPRLFGQQSMLAGFGIIGVRSVGSVFGSGARCSVRPGPGERGRWKQEVVFGHYGTPLILPFIDLGEKVMVRWRWRKEL